MTNGVVTATYICRACMHGFHSCGLFATMVVGHQKPTCPICRVPIDGEDDNDTTMTTTMMTMMTTMTMNPPILPRGEDTEGLACLRIIILILWRVTWFQKQQQLDLMKKERKYDDQQHYLVLF